MQHSLSFGKFDIIILSCLFGGVVQAEAEVVELGRSAMLSHPCAACHGTDGHSPGAIPGISGKPGEYIETTLLEFRSGKRFSTVMDRHAKGYTDEEIRLIAEFFSNRKLGVPE